MTINPNAKIPAYHVLITSIDGIRREIEHRGRPLKDLKKLEVIYDQLNFIIKST